MRAMGRIGLFGGSFNPVHNAHVVMAIEAFEQLGLDEMRLLPLHDPPHKAASGLRPGTDRVRALRSAFDGLRGFVVDERELRRGGRSYTIETLLELRSQEPGQDWYFLIGEDSLEDLPRWHRSSELAALATFAVAPRGSGRSGGTPEPAGFRVSRLATTPWGLSSTAVRARAREGLTLRGFVPDPVAAMIAAEGWYRS
jgi:nicotinate-nucleotide adenylyltransferase